MRKRTGFDKTRNYDFINEHASRIMAWDTLRCGLLGETYNVQDISERTGMPVQNLYATIETIKEKISDIYQAYKSKNYES